MLKWFRGRTRHVAATLVLSLAALGVPHSADPNHDTDYAIGVVVGHDASAHQLVADESDTESHPHCVACHAARSFSPRVQLRQLAPSSHAVSLFLFAIVTVPSADPVAQPSLRAPPSSPRFA